jgi:hypothetical protein
VARRPNYGFVKRQKELQKQQRKDEKDAKKRLKAESAGGDEQAVAGENDDENPGSAEDSPSRDAS